MFCLVLAREGWRADVPAVQHCPVQGNREVSLLDISHMVNSSFSSLRVDMQDMGNMPLIDMEDEVNKL